MTRPNLGWTPLPPPFYFFQRKKRGALLKQYDFLFATSTFSFDQDRRQKEKKNKDTSRRGRGTRERNKEGEGNEECIKGMVQYRSLYPQYHHHPCNVDNLMPLRRFTGK
ncbi:hypothetical protein NPIL_530121 [Nephila pilipes]|uniref:Uncharacterized protein n=1 Tax=Nephila pilipes TaxID=299642 RepID=A0A8X6T152_NEPPI|nr:hypothetical protein NPIL_530121 [Nephila pilipes]